MVILNCNHNDSEGVDKRKNLILLKHSPPIGLLFGGMEVCVLALSFDFGLLVDGVV